MRVTRTDSLTMLREALATLPSELDARADFFVQWRARTIQSLELIYLGEPEVAQRFKEIEFSPRRLTKNDARDDQLRLDAFLSGCVTARAMLEELIRHVQASLDAMPAPVRTPEEPAPEPAPPAEPEATFPPSPAAEPLTAFLEQPPLYALAPSTEDAQTSAPAAPRFEPAPLQGARMPANELCAPVRSSLARVLGAWETGDRETALVLSAQLLAELTLLSRDDRFKSAFEGVVTKFVDVKGVAGGLDSLHAAAPLCVWSMVAAMNEVMKAA